MTVFIRVGRGEKTKQFTLSPEIVEVIDRALSEAWRKEPAGPTGERTVEGRSRVAEIADFKEALEELKD